MSSSSSCSCLCSRDEVKTKWSVSDFVKAFIKFHGHVYLSKSVDKLDALREKLEEQFQVSLHLWNPGAGLWLGGLGSHQTCAVIYRG